LVHPNARDAVLLHLVVKCCPADLECGSGSATIVPRVAQGGFDYQALGLVTVLNKRTNRRYRDDAIEVLATAFADLPRQVRGKQFGAVADEHGLLYDVFELADVAGPGKRFQGGNRVAVDAEERLAELGAKLGDHASGQRADILRALVERFKVNGK